MWPVGTIWFEEGEGILTIDQIRNDQSRAAHEVQIPTSCALAQDRGEQLAAEEKSVKYQTFLNQLNLKFSKKII